MKKLLLLPIFLTLILSCNSKIYDTNGEAIYRTGKNLKGERLMNRKDSRIKIAASCKTCHGRNGDKMNSVSVKFSYLSNPANFSTPYTDSLFFRFLDLDLKSDGIKANIGVIWKMNQQDKNDLLDYLKRF